MSNVASVPAWLALGMAITITSAIGCDRGPGPPQIVDGPLPRTPRTESLKRVRQLHGPWHLRMERTLWMIDGQLTWPDDRLTNLRRAVQNQLEEVFTRKQIAQDLNGRPFERPSSHVRATVISLEPDIVVASVAEIPIESRESPFHGWPSIPHGLSHLGNYRSWKSDYISTYHGLGLCAGSLLPHTSEMYAISANPEAVPKRIEFDNGQAEFFIDGANVLLIRNGDEVEVVVHYDPN